MVPIPKNSPPESIKPLEVSVHEHFIGPRYSKHLEHWGKAKDRLLGDEDGAVTAARALLETTCKHILDELKIAYDTKAKMPQLYNSVCKALGMAPSDQKIPEFRAIFSSTYQIVQSVTEFRNIYGDAHGKTSNSVRVSRANAELAVHLAGSLSCFLVRHFESFLSATYRLTADGKTILRFDKSTVWRLVDHAMNSPKSAQSFGEGVGSCLMLVGDAGTYLISNGIPKMLSDGTLNGKKIREDQSLFVAYAEGCDASADIDAWWPIHNAIDDGNDFALPIQISELRKPLEDAQMTIVIVADGEQYIICSDVEFERLSEPYF